MNLLLKVLVLLCIAFTSNSQELGLPVYRFTEYYDLNDSTTLFRYTPIDSEGPVEEVYIEVNGICTEVQVWLYGDRTYDLYDVLTDDGYIRTGYNRYVKSGYIEVIVEYNLGYTEVKFLLIE